MVNFKAIHEKWWNGLSKEEQERITKRRELEKENTFYQTTTILDNDKNKNEICEQEVLLYRPVYGGGEVGERILISFGGYREYSFDLKFCKKMLRDLKVNENGRLCIDAGREVYVNRKETVRIITEALKALGQRGISLCDDYFPSLTNSDMGKMLEGMDLR